MNKKAVVLSLILLTPILANAQIDPVNVDDGKTIEIVDDKTSPKDRQKVTIKETKEVKDFEGSLYTINSEILPGLYDQREAIQRSIERYETLRDTISAEVDKLPNR